jgi:hypothetical protein
MRKIKLDPEQLAVESFDTVAKGKRQSGTVFGEQCTCYTNCSCPGCPTCDASCNDTCGATCDASCNGTCDASCNGTCAVSCGATCDGSCYGTCHYTCHYPGPCYWEN